MTGTAAWPDRAVLVTGMGVVTPVGVGVDQFHEAQLAARSGIRPISLIDLPADNPVGIAGEVDLPPELMMDRRDALRSDRCTQLVVAAADLAIEHAKLNLDGIDPTRAGVVIGSGGGGLGTTEDACRQLYEAGARAVRARTIPMLMLNSPAAAVAIRFGLTGPCTAVATACASGADAIIAAAQAIRAGDADLVLAGGGEAPITRLVLSGFAALGALASDGGTPERASKPFDANRTGFVLAEGSAVLVLESAAHAAARGAQVHARLAGYGRSSDAFHATMPHPAGAGAAAALRAALAAAGACPSDVGFVNSHGTATKLNDAAESKALHAVFGDAIHHVPIAATKSIMGHSLGAAGAVEAVATIQALSSGLVPPTANLDTPDPELGVDVVRGTPRRVDAALALSNSFAFGGHNAVLAFARAA
jgi:3-oxoacyl-[acyl-carrier-protein] synthase II